MRNKNSLLFNWKQKILLNLLDCLDDKKYSRLKIFKIAFLLSRNNNFYDFTPYKYGPYSFEMDKDLRIFNNKSLINMKDNSISINKDAINFLSLKSQNKYKNFEIVDKFKNLDETELINFIYQNYPYYSQNSLLLNQSKMEQNTSPVSIYTIGYQDISIDSFINILIKKGIKILLDVRNKPLSYKYGFNYYWLNKYLPEFGIKYINIPELGIEEQYRKKLPLNELWNYYLNSLKLKNKYLNRACDIILKQPTTLMCYEMDPENCHRLILAKKLKGLIKLPVVNFHIKEKQWIKLNY
ncbi:MAG: DUF488 domain-containing protein [Elusimicrobiales bacterium]|nr:DUF488 domain-containing protein [Elusimicrobiales bacterium]